MDCVQIARSLTRSLGAISIDVPGGVWTVRYCAGKRNRTKSVVLATPWPQEFVRSPKIGIVGRQQAYSFHSIGTGRSRPVLQSTSTENVLKLQRVDFGQVLRRSVEAA